MTETLFKNDARGYLLEGINEVADAVGSTLGAGGRLVVIPDPIHGAKSTKDGVSVARVIEPENKFRRAGARLLKQAAANTNEEAGDGTTTSTVLAQAIINEGYKYLSSGFNPNQMKIGMERACQDVIKFLKEKSREVDMDELDIVATISANGDAELGKIVADAFKKVGKTGQITVTESETKDTYLDLSEGLAYDRGLIDPVFINEPEKYRAVIKDAAVLLVNKKISNIQEILEGVKYCASNGKPLYLVCSDITRQALEPIAVNKLQKDFKVVITKVPYIGEEKTAFFDDLAALTGSTVVSELHGNEVTADVLGTCDKVISDDVKTIVVGGEGNAEKRVKVLEEQLKERKNKFDRKDLKERIARLKGGVGTLYIGGSTEAERQERLDRAEDAKNATLAALKEGIVAGGGSTLARSSTLYDGAVAISNEDQRIGYQIVAKATQAPLRKIVENAGESPDVIVERVLDTEFAGFNAVTCEMCNDIYEEGIIDPVMVTRLALENAVSVAGIILMTAAVVVDLD